MKIRLARQYDNQGLCQVDFLCTQGKGLVFHYEREDFFLRPKLYDKWAVYIAEIGGVIAGSISACVKDVHLNGSVVRIGYVFDWRVHPDYRLTRAAAALVQAAKEYLLQEGAQYAYTYVLGSNIATMRMVQKMGMFIAAPFQVFFLSALPTGVDVLRISDKDRLNDAWARIEKYQSRYDLSEQISLARRYVCPFPGSPFHGIFTLPGSSDVQGCMWDSSVLSTKVVDRIPFLYRATAIMPPPVRRLLGLPPLPEKGQPLRIHHIFDVAWDEEDIDPALKLIAGLRALAGSEGGQIVMCHLDARDPLCASVKRQAFYSLEGTLLLRTTINGEKPPPLSRAYFDVRDF